MVIKIINAMFAGAMQMMAFYDAIFSQNVIADFIKYSTLIVRILLPFVFLFQVYKQVVVNQDSSYLDVLFRLVVVMILLSVYPAFYIQTVNTVDEISYNLIMETGVKERLENEGVGLDAIGSGEEEEGERNLGGFCSEMSRENSWRRDGTSCFALRNLSFSLRKCSRSILRQITVT